MIRAVPGVAAMAAYALADMGGPGMISLAQNESAFGPSPKALAAGRAALATAALYPDPDWTDLRRAIASVHRVDPDRILCGAGSMDLIGAVIRAFAGPGDEVLGSAHGYLFVATACQLAGARYVTAPEPALAVDIALVLQAVTPRTRVVFVCNPGNPTGTTLLTADILRLRAALPEPVLLVVDQAYGEFDSQDPAPVFALADRGDTVVLRTFSKAYALASARVGWGVFPAAISAETRKVMPPNNVPAVSQAMAMAAMRDQAHMADIVARTATIRDRFSADLRDAGFAIPVARTNFVLIPFGSTRIARAADAALRAEGLLLRGMAGYGLPHCLRATIGPAPVMARAARVLAPFAKDMP